MTTKTQVNKCGAQLASETEILHFAVHLLTSIQAQIAEVTCKIDVECEEHRIAARGPKPNPSDQLVFLLATPPRRRRKKKAPPKTDSPLPTVVDGEPVTATNGELPNGTDGTESELSDYEDAEETVYNIASDKDVAKVVNGAVFASLKEPLRVYCRL